MKILIAEDDATSRLLLETTLKQWGHEVVAASDGSQAWEVLQQEDTPHLAIFDWMMPGLDGVEVCRKARAQGQMAHLYIIMLTTRDTKDDIAEALEAGADDYVNKPFNRKELQARIHVGKRVLDLQRPSPRASKSWKHPSSARNNFRAYSPSVRIAKKYATTIIIGRRSSAI
jgi:phosphoserine phosphatase RsbU/P